MERAPSYRLLGRISQGGMAEVLLAEQFSDGRFQRQVAMKRLLASARDDKDLAQLLQREARLMRLASHPNVIHVFDFPVIEGTEYVAMELVEGPSCLELLSVVPRVPPALVSRMGVDAAAALHHAHTLRDAGGEPLHIVHRDVSPENLLITWSGQVKLADFGIAISRITPRLTREGMVRGKLVYMSPEQMQGGEVDARADVYALGAVLHHLLSGNLPFEELSDPEVIAAVLSRAPPRLSPDVPGPLAELLSSALSKNPSERPPSAKHFGQAMENACTPATPQQLADFLARHFDDRHPVRTRMQRARRAAPQRTRPVEAATSAPLQAIASNPSPSLSRRRRSAAGIAALFALGLVAAFWRWTPGRRRDVAAAPAVPTAPTNLPTPNPVAAPVAEEPTSNVPHPPLKRRRPAPSRTPVRPATLNAPVEVSGEQSCTLSLDGRDVGSLSPGSPVTLRSVTTGKHLLRCQAIQKGLDVQKKLELFGGLQHIHFAPGRAVLRVRVAPWGRVVVDGQDLGLSPIAPLTVFEGRHEVSVSGATETRTEAVQLKAGEDHLLLVRLGKVDE